MPPALLLICTKAMSLTDHIRVGNMCSKIGLNGQLQKFFVDLLCFA